MESPTVTEDMERAFAFAPVDGRANEYIIRARIPLRNGDSKKEMTPADWDKFEKDITDAFEQVP